MNTPKTEAGRVDIYCIYHAECLDGFAAAMAIVTKHPHAHLMPWTYGKPAPLVSKDSLVYIVDFSFPMEELIQLAQLAHRVWVFDHHISAIEKLTQSPLPKPANLELHLDVNQSGAGLVWREFFLKGEIPDYVWAVEDRDLWKFERPLTREICRFLMTLEMDVDIWKTLDNSQLVTMVTLGKVLLAEDARQIRWHLDHTLRMVKILDHVVPLVNVPKYLVSETLNEIVDGHPFVVGYHDTAQGRVLRFNSSQKDGMDCSKLAASFGGGGHKHAAGAIVPRDHPLASL